MADFFQQIGSALGILVLYLGMLAGILLIPFGIPGEFLTVAAIGIFTLVASSGTLPWWVVLACLGLAILAELLEFAIAFLSPKQARGSLWSGVGAFAGGLGGAILGSSVFPVLGSLVGAFVGTFAGAYAVEIYLHRDRDKSWEVAKTAVIARLVGVAVKMTLAVGMVCLVSVMLIVGSR